MCFDLVDVVVVDDDCVIEFGGGYGVELMIEDCVVIDCDEVFGGV